MSEDFVNDRRIFDGGDEPHRGAIVGTGGHVDGEHAFEQLGPAQPGSRGSRGSLAFCISGG